MQTDGRNVYLKLHFELMAADSAFVAFIRPLKTERKKRRDRKNKQEPNENCLWTVLIMELPVIFLDSGRWSLSSSS